MYLGKQTMSLTRENTFNKCTALQKVKERKQSQGLSQGYRLPWRAISETIGACCSALPPICPSRKSTAKVTFILYIGLGSQTCLANLVWKNPMTTPSR